MSSWWDFVSTGLSVHIHISTWISLLHHRHLCIIHNQFIYIFQHNFHCSIHRHLRVSLLLLPESRWCLGQSVIHRQCRFENRWKDGRSLDKARHCSAYEFGQLVRQCNWKKKKTVSVLQVYIMTHLKRSCYTQQHFMKKKLFFFWKLKWYISLFWR